MCLAHAFIINQIAINYNLEMCKFKTLFANYKQLSALLYNVKYIKSQYQKNDPSILPSIEQQPRS